MAESKNSNGAKAFGGFMAVLAIIGVMSAMWLPLADRQSALKDDLKDHGSPDSHSLVQTERIKALSERLDQLEAWRENWILTVPALDATQNGRLDMIERQLFGGD